MSVHEACEQIGVRPTQFANVRLQALQSMVSGMQPKPVGRRAHLPVVSERERALEQRVAELERENHLLRAQVEVAALRREAVLRPKSGDATSRSDAAGGAVP